MIYLKKLLCFVPKQRYLEFFMYLANKYYSSRCVIKRKLHFFTLSFRPIYIISFQIINLHKLTLQFEPFYLGVKWDIIAKLHQLINCDEKSPFLSHLTLGLDGRVHWFNSLKIRYQRSKLIDWRGDIKNEVKV